MALTRYQIPQDFTPAYNEQNIVYLSDQISQPNFKYIVVVQINGGDSFQNNIYPRPDGFLVFDVKEIVSNYISTYFNPESLVYRGFTDVASVIVDITESTSSTSPSTDNFSYLAFNACLKKNIFNDFVAPQWYKQTLSHYSISPPYMNESANEINLDSFVTKKTDYWITFIRGLATRVTCNIYDTSNSLVGTSTIDLSIYDSDYLVRLNLSPNNIFGLVSLAPQNGFRIEATLEYFTGAIWSILDTITMPTINDVCTKYDVYRLYFLKRNGAIGYKTFEKVSELRVDKKVNEVRLNPSNIYSDGMGGYLYGYPKDKHFSNVVSTESTYTLNLNTDWISEAQSIKLEELFDSPKVWLQDDKDGSVLAVNIKENNYTFKQHANEQLFNYNVTVELSQKETRQRGI